jgi:hypothetical protein
VILAPLLTRKEFSSSMIAGTASPATTLIMWRASTWAPLARWTMALWQLAVSGPTARALTPISRSA